MTNYEYIPDRLPVGGSNRHIKKTENMKRKKFPNGVARFFNPEKSYNQKSSGIHQAEKRKGIPVYNGKGPARRVTDEYGNVSYK